MGRRVLSASTVAVAALLGVQQPAVAQEATPITELIVGAQGRLSPRDRLTWGPVNALQRTYDADGTLLSEEVPADVAEVSTLAAGSYTCYADRYPKSLKTYDQVYLTKNTADVYFLYMFQPYLYNDARIVEGQHQDQLEVCGVGGADMKPDRGRLLRTGPSATIMRSATKITVSDDWPNNAVHAWWESACSAWPWCGSHDYEGATVHGLWEFLNGRRGYEDLYVEAYAVWH